MRHNKQRVRWPVRSCRPEGEARHTAAEAILGSENVGGPVVTANAEGEARHTAAEATLGSENVGGPVVTANGEGEARHTAAEATRSPPGTHTLQRRRGRRFYLQSAGD